METWIHGRYPSLDKVALSVGVSVATLGQSITAFSLAAAIGTPIFMMATAKMDKCCIVSSCCCRGTGLLRPYACP